MFIFLVHAAVKIDFPVSVRVFVCVWGGFGSGNVPRVSSRSRACAVFAKLGADT